MALPSPHPMVVYICPGADPADPTTWAAAAVDVTSYVRVASGVTIKQGRPDEAGTVGPSTCNLTLNNRDGRFSTRNAMGAYYPDLVSGTPLLVTWDGQTRFAGCVYEWPPRWDRSGNDAWVPVRADGVLRRFQQNSPPLRSALYRELMRRDNAGMVAYWPCEDASGASSLASALPGQHPILFSGDASLASFSDFLASAPLPVFNSGALQGPVSAYSITGETILRLFVHIPADGGVDGRELASIDTTGTARHWGIGYHTTSGGSLRLRVADAEGNVLLDGSVTTFAVDGHQFSLSLELTQDGADVDWTLLVFKILPDGTSSAAQTSGTLNSETVGRVTTVYASPGGDTSMTFGHVVVGNDTNLFANTADALLAWVGETAAARFERLLAEQGESSTIVGTAVTSMPMGAQMPGKLLDLLRECEVADMGIMHESDGALAYRVRTELYNQTVALALDVADGEVADPPEPTDDDQQMANEITVSRQGGSSATSLDQAHIDAHGRYPDSRTVNVESDDLLANIASWLVHLGTVDQMRWPKITLALHRNPNLIADWINLSATLGKRMTVAHTITQLPGVEIDVLIQGWTERIGLHTWDVELNCAPASPYDVFVLNDTTYGRLGKKAADLRSAMDTTDTSLTTGLLLDPYVWEAAAVPVNIIVGGEEMTVTNVVGSSGTQTLTVTRSVNGVVKSHAFGAPVRLAHELVLAL